MSKFQPICGTDLTQDEFRDLHTLVKLQETTVSSLVGDLIRKELAKRQYLIRLNANNANNAQLLLEISKDREKDKSKSGTSNEPSSAAARPATPPAQTLPFVSFQ